MPVLNKRKDHSPNRGQTAAVRLVEVTAAHEGQRLDNFLMRLCKGVPKSHVYKSVRMGSVRVNRGRTNVSYRLEIGDVVRIPPFRIAQTTQAPVPARVYPIVYEDDALIVIDKPAGVAVHGGSGVSFGVIESLRAAHPEWKYLELVHRLDRDTSGLLILAKQRRALVRMHAMMREGDIEKHYAALVCGRVLNDRQHLRAPLLRWLTVSGERRVRVDQEGMHAHTIMTCVQRYALYSWVDAQLMTGRTHQIRVHMAHEGHPIVGDDKYGDEGVNQQFAQLGFKRMFLHASHLTFLHPLTQEKLELHAPLPPACEQALKIAEGL